MFVSHAVSRVTGVSMMRGSGKSSRTEGVAADCVHLLSAPPASFFR